MEATEPDLSPDREGTAGAATEETLGGLHAAVATTLTDVLVNGAVVTDKEGEVHKITAPAAYIGAAIAFLKNNNITASPTKNRDLVALQQTLSQKRRGKGGAAALREAAAEFERMQGGNGMMQ